MGGPGSGAWRIVDCKKLIENSLRVSVRAWQRANSLAAGTAFIHEWFADDGSFCGAAQITAFGSSVEISYMIGEDQINNLIAVTWVPCLKYYRAFFVCPDCGRRVVHLYLGKKYMLCRHCYNLAYKSQRSSLNR